MSSDESPLTAADVRAATFEKPPWPTRGYDEKSVTDFLQLAARRLDGRGHLSAQDIRGIRFPKPPFGKRGIDAAGVDDFIGRVARAIDAIETDG